MYINYTVIIFHSVVRDLIVGQRSKLLGYKHQSMSLFFSVHLTFKVSKIYCERVEILMSLGRFSVFSFAEFPQTI